MCSPLIQYRAQLLGEQSITLFFSLQRCPSQKGISLITE